MPVEMKKGIRKRIACMMGTTQKAIREAEAECDGRAFMYHAKGTLCGFYLLHVPVKGKIAPTLFPTEEALQKPSLILRPESFYLLHRQNFCANDCSGYF
jgi:hypothetical protein